MKVECATEELAAALKRMGGSGNSDAAPYMRHVLLQASDSRLRLTTSGFATQTEIEMAATVHEPGACAPAMAAFSGLVQRFSRPSLSLSHANGGLQIKSGRSVYDLRTLESDDYPVVKPLENATWLCFESGNALADLFRPVIHAVADHQSDIAGLTGVRLHVAQGKLIAVATDRHNLARNAMPSPDVSEGFSAVLPGDPAAQMVSAARKIGAAPVRLGFTDRNARMKGADYIFTFRLLPNDYPDYERVLPQVNRPTFKIAAPDLLGAVERLMCVVPQDKSKPQCATFTVADGIARITYTGQDGHQADEELEASDVGDERTSTMHLPKLATAISMWGDMPLDVHITTGRHFTMLSESAPDMLQLVMAQTRT